MKYKHVKGKVHIIKTKAGWTRLVDPFGQSIFESTKEATDYLRRNLDALNTLLSPRFWNKK